MKYDMSFRFKLFYCSLIVDSYIEILKKIEVVWFVMRYGMGGKTCVLYDYLYG